MTNSKPLISIAIPTYNEEEYIGRCLKSISKQNMSDKIEVLIIDDDSTDKTLEIARSFQNKINVRILRNGNKDAEKGKKIGLAASTGEFFMYLDADMEYADANWFDVSTKPLLEDKKIIGTLASFGVSNDQNAITRCISYDIFQRDPIFIAFTPGIKKTIIEKREGYHLCEFRQGAIPGQSLCLYRADVLKKLFKDDPFLMDNDVPVKLVKMSHKYFAFCPQVKIYHFLLKNLRELFKKRMRGVLKTYMAHLSKREYKWINLEKKSNILLLGIWVVYANLLVPATIYGAYKSLKHRDYACLYEPLITIVSTDALIWGFLKSKGKIGDLFKI